MFTITSGCSVVVVVVINNYFCISFGSQCTGMRSKRAQIGNETLLVLVFYHTDGVMIPLWTSAYTAKKYFRTSYSELSVVW